MSKDFLERDLERWRKEVAITRKFKNYVNGTHSEAWHSEKMKKNGSWLLSSSVANFSNVAINAYKDGLSIERWSGEVPEEFIRDMARIEGYIDYSAFAYGNAYTVTVRNPNDTVSTYHQPSDTMLCTPDPFNPTVLSRATKFWQNDEAFFIEVIDSEMIHRYRSNIFYNQAVEAFPKAHVFEHVSSEPHGFTVVPVCQFKYNPESHFGSGRSVLTDALVIQDAYNKYSADSLMASEANVHPTRYLMGFKEEHLLPSVDKDGNAEPPKITFDATKDSILLHPGTGAGEFGGPDIQGIINLKKEAKVDYANALGLPPHYFSNTPDNVSAESLSIYAGRVRNARKSYRAENTSVWNGLAKLHGYDVYPIWAEEEIIFAKRETSNSDEAPKSES